MLVFGVYCQDGLLPSNLVRVNRFGAPARSLLVSWWTPLSKIVIVVTKGLAGLEREDGFFVAKAGQPDEPT